MRIDLTGRMHITANTQRPAHEAIVGHLRNRADAPWVRVSCIAQGVDSAISKTPRNLSGTG